ncbi:hypothetical protein Glove_9g271 [Diversispora epigaea]|uniref:Protein kinase domain-containing protein n=1 Tax=Diversispora epigaea TaxID=1348612 RepID=A0A397JQ32_9GLOM|nr:hypothetical protein Glove_9g271 [Diversispora epigaea]
MWNKELLEVWDRIYYSIDDTKVHKTFNEREKYCQKIIQNHSTLTESEKDFLIDEIRKAYDKVRITTKDSEQQRCKVCQSKHKAIQYCEACIRKYLVNQFGTWTSGNNKIDETIKECQQKVIAPHCVIEWIDYDQFENIEYKTEGGFSVIYTANWKEGFYFKWDSDKQSLQRFGTHEVILKNFTKSNKYWWQEVELNFTLDNTSQYLVKCYGITKNPTNNEYMLVLGHYEKNLRQFLNDTQSLSLLQKYNIILDIAYSLSKIHEEKVIHRDLHSANILYYSDADRWFISDLGFSSPINDSNNIFKIYGDLPHIAPEVYGNILTTKSDGSTIKHTEKSDIYSLGIIMWEVFTGKIPFDGRKHDIDLALDIFTNKSRPDINNMDKNKEYVKLMIKCWDHDPDKRPDITEIYKRMESLIRPIICKLKEGGGGIGGNHTFSKFNMKKIKNYIKGLMKNNNDSKENKKLESKSDSNRINIPQIIESKDENPLTSNIFTKSVEVCDSRQCSECIISDNKRPDIIEIYKRMESLIRPIICKLKEGGGGIGGNHTFSKFNMKKIKNYIKGLMKNNNDSKENKKLESKSDSNRINIPQIIESKDENPLTSNIFTKSVEVCDSRQCSECIISDRIELDFNKNNENEATAIEDGNENDIEKTDDNFGSQDNNNRNKITHPLP